MTTTTVRTETEELPDGKLLIEVFEDTTKGGLGHRVMLTLMGEAVALGRANLGQVFRQLSRTKAESLVDAILGSVRAQDGLSADGALRARLEAEKAAKAAAERGKEEGLTLPIPVKARGERQVEAAGVELDPFGRRDLADKLRQLADAIEVRDQKVLLQEVTIEPIRGGGQVIAVKAIRRT